MARAKEQSLTLAMSGLVGANAETNQTLVQLRELERESETYRNLYQTFMQRYQEALQQQSFPVSEARVITAATPPAYASYPKRGLILALSLVFGAMVGSGLGALREYRDRVFRVASHVRDELGLEFLGMLQVVDTVVTAKSAKGREARSRANSSREFPAALFDRPSALQLLRDPALGQSRGRSVAGGPQAEGRRRHFRAAERGQVDGREEFRVAPRPSRRPVPC